MTIYNKVIHDPSSVTSFGRYTLVLDEATTTYEMIVQILADTPHQRDWRTEFNTVAGRYERVDAAFTFHVERGSTAVRSSAWSGRGVQPFAPFASFTGHLDGDTLTVAYLGEIALKRGDRPIANANLIIPDYEFE